MSKMRMQEWKLHKYKIKNRATAPAQLVKDICQSLGADQYALFLYEY